MTSFLGFAAIALALDRLARDGSSLSQTRASCLTSESCLLAPISTSTRNFREGGKRARRNPPSSGSASFQARHSVVIVSVAMECVSVIMTARCPGAKASMIAPGDSGNNGGRHRGLEREIRICAKRPAGRRIAARERKFETIPMESALFG